MDAATEKILVALEQAIKAEVDGHHFYKMAAKSTEDPKGRTVFERLGEDEVAHARFLQAQYDSVRETGKTDPTIELGDATSYDGAHPIFSDALQERIKDAHYEMSALAIGVQLELSAIRFYRDNADSADDPEFAKFFRELADWESRHYDALLKQQEALKQNYWNAGRFSPF